MFLYGLYRVLVMGGYSGGVTGGSGRGNCHRRASKDVRDLVEQFSNVKEVVKHDAHVDAWVAYKNRPWTLSNYFAAGVNHVVVLVDRIGKFLS